MNSQPENFMLILQAENGWPTTGTQRLRLALKKLGRAYGLRCVECRQCDAPVTRCDDFPADTTCQDTIGH